MICFLLVQVIGLLLRLLESFGLRLSQEAQAFKRSGLFQFYGRIALFKRSLAAIEVPTTIPVVCLPLLKEAIERVIAPNRKPISRTESVRLLSIVERLSRSSPQPIGLDTHTRVALAYLGKPEAQLPSVMNTRHTPKNILGGLALTTPPYPLHHTPSVRITHCLWLGLA